jgi:fluoride exporter
MPPEDRHDASAEVRRLEQAAVDPDLPTPSRRRGRPPRPGVLVAIALGGVLGTATRYGVSRIAPVGPGAFPWPTFSVNVTGSFALGVILTFVIERWPPSRYLRPFVAIGFLGAYTTFSTFMTEAVLLGKDAHVGMAVTYLATSLVCGLTAVYAGIVLVRLRPIGKGGL